MAMAFKQYRHWLITRPYLTSAVTSAAVLAAGDALAQSIEHHQYLTAHPSATTNPALAFQPNRTLILSLWGGAVFSPFFTRFFQFLESQPSLKARSSRNLAIRVVAIFAVAQPLNAAFFLYCSALEYALPVDRLGAAHIDAAVVGPSSKLLEQTTLDTPSSTSLAAVDLPATSGIPPIPHSILPAPSPFSSPDNVSLSSIQTAYQVISQRTVAQLVEKFPTVVFNATLVWGPFNLINQSIVPVQWRVVSSSFVSVIWNCYLSITAHEEVKEAVKELAAGTATTSLASIPFQPDRSR